ncbi:caspase family protein [Mediterraneibacter glycyrrhizinilyticus]|uniref:caspase family protein n=1 Tax=Mediterraneibacter glycyrrhizinilyticus TaxID=342942 RepID=UPI0025A34CB4|nr:caspase family protein [Mediterraneibacter glycyrrhizinilyticus]MDM8212220.1 caspase family protein [Mediterraneibacter glycyrrhizinilyticus]
MKKALVVGIDEYPTCPLSGCVNDALAISELLETNGDGSPNFDVRTIPNVSTKSDLLDSVEELFAGDADIALFYFSGHGADIGGGYLVTPDFHGRDLGVTMMEVLGIANRSKCKNKIIILDCCYSGKFGENSVSDTKDSVLGEGVTIMTASSRSQVSIENTLTGHGVFTELLIQGLKGSAADIGGNITPASLYSFVDQSLGAWEQRPIFKTNISRFLPIRTIEAKVPKAILRKISSYFPNPTDEYNLNPSYEFTNTPDCEHIVIEPYADEANIQKFKELQLFESVGLIEPVGTEHMYFAAMESKSCKLTALGLHYWRLAKDKRF